MQEFRNKVAVITGAANGFGTEFAKAAARRGMKLILADIDKPNLKKIVREVKALGAEVYSIHRDLSLQAGVTDMIRYAMDKFGAIDLLINNAGIAFGGRLWDVPLRDWEWMTDINYKAHVWAMKEVIPIMMAQGTSCHILNVVSASGMMTSPDMWSYQGVKFAALATAESILYDLQLAEADINISCYCPGYVHTDLHNSERHRPARYQAPDDPYYSSEIYFQNREKLNQNIQGGTPLEGVGELVFGAIERNEFYIITHPEYNPYITKRVENMMENENPDVNELY